MKSRMAGKEFFSSALFSRLDITLSTKSPSSQVESRYAYHLHSSLFLHPARIEQTPRSGYLRIVVTRCYSYTRRRRTQHRQQHENERPRKRSKEREEKKREKTSNTVSGEHVSLAHEKKERSSIFWFDEPLPNVFFRIERRKCRSRCLQSTSLSFNLIPSVFARNETLCNVSHAETESEREKLEST